MRLKLTLLMLIGCMLPVFAQTGIKATLVDAQTGRPVADANVLLRDQAIFVTTGADGSFEITNAQPGNDVVQVVAFLYDDAEFVVEMKDGLVANLGVLQLNPSGVDIAEMNSSDFLFDESQIMDEDDVSQGIGTIQGAVDDIYYQQTNYYNNIGRIFRNRGYNNDFTAGYINGVEYNDLMRGTFNFSGLGGMTSNAFRNRTTDPNLEAANYGIGRVGGSQNFTTYASEYAPGFRGGLAYTNSSYMLRAMLQYSTGITKNGWAVSGTVIGRYAPNGVNPIPGTWYNSFGYALSVQKIFNDKHSLNLTTWGAPTERAGNSWTVKEAYELSGNNLYNPNWGYQDGKKRNSKVIRSFDPSVMLNWLFKPAFGTTINTAVAFRHNEYAQTGISWYNAADPRPDYYRYLPSYYKPTADPNTEPDLYAQQMETYELYTDLWQNNEEFRQMNWNQMYQTNYLNCISYERDPALRGVSTYILENSHSNFNSWMFNSYADTRLNDFMTLQGGVSFNYTDAHYYKTVDDLLGGEFWRDVDTFAERDFPGNSDVLQNDLNNPERPVKKGEVFGYDYNIRSYQAKAWLQNKVNTTHWDVNYGLELTYTNFMRHGNMRNGRAPENSYGAGKRHTFDDAFFKAGATYKLNGRNYFVGHFAYGSVAPVPYNAYVQSRIKDDAVNGLASARILSADLSYVWNYKNFRGSITGFWTDKWNGLETTYYYDYSLNTNMVYTLSGVHTQMKGLELGMQYKILPGLSVSGAATLSRYQYKNNPNGTKSYQNGAAEDILTKVYLKNFFLGCAPMQAYSLAVNYNTNGWFFEVNGNWFGSNYVYLSPTRHEEMPGLINVCSTEAEMKAKIEEIAYQDKMNDAFVLNASIGKVLYTKFGSVNFNLGLNNLLNNRNIQTTGKQEGKFDYTNYDINKFPNKYYYAQGIRIFLNVGIRF